MSKKPKINTDPQKPISYQIRIEGQLGSEWNDWFEGLTISLEEDGNSLLTGPVNDQAALFGLLRKIRDLGVALISVNRLDPEKDLQSDQKGA